MNSSVWYEQIDRGLLQFIPSIIRLKDSEGLEVPVPVRIRKADEDFKVEDYPMVTITNLYTSRRDEVRYYPFKVLRGYDKSTAKGNLELPAVPYSVFYQLDFWSTFQEDMNTMLSQWCFHVSRDFNLPVIDSGGTHRDAYALQIGDTLKRTDKLSGSDRVFCSSLTYRIWAELDESSNNVESCDIVTGVDLNIKST